MSEIDLRGGVAVVTGGAGTSAGLGEGLVRRLAAEGMRVAILDLDGAAAEALASQLRADGAEAIGVAADVTNVDSLRAAAEQVRASFGTCTVLCAHVGGGGQGRFVDLSIDQWRSALDLMVVGTLTTVHAFLPLLRDTDGPRRIVLTSSAAALVPGAFQGPYRAAKVAVTSIGETIDIELGPEGIGATIVFPSGMVPAAFVDRARAAIGRAPDASDDIRGAIAAELITEPSDITTGDDAAAAVVEAIRHGRRYVVTHGDTVGRDARARHAQLDEAFTRAAARTLAH